VDLFYKVISICVTINLSNRVAQVWWMWVNGEQSFIFNSLCNTDSMLIKCHFMLSVKTVVAVLVGESQTVMASVVCAPGNKNIDWTQSSDQFFMLCRQRTSVQRLGWQHSQSVELDSWTQVSCTQLSSSFHYVAAAAELFHYCDDVKDGANSGQCALILYWDFGAI